MSEQIDNAPLIDSEAPVIEPVLPSVGSILRVAREVRGLRARLERLLGPREGWDLPLLRALFDALMERAGRRRRSAEHERC